jgi:hypothetical protein
VLGTTFYQNILRFHNSSGSFIGSTSAGATPASGFLPYSSYKITTSQITSLIDETDTKSFYFNPFTYSVEGGRSDWLEVGLNLPVMSFRSYSNSTTNQMHRSYTLLDNAGKTLIDFSHPFSASGRITKIYAGLTLDNTDTGYDGRGAYDEERKDTQLQDAKIMFFRPRRDGSLEVLDTELAIPNRDHDGGKLYSKNQEYTELDCDIFVNKGDLIGIYNANVYQGKSVTGSETDAVYYQLDGKASGNLEVNEPYGQGQAGLLIYARSDQIQNRLVLDVDMSDRVNLSDIHVLGESEELDLEYNIARCVDVDWDVDLFGETNTTGYIITYRPLVKRYYSHPNIYYGKDCLSDGIKIVPDGLAADSFSVSLGTSYEYYDDARDKGDGGAGVVPSNAKYFHLNGDQEWLTQYVHPNRSQPFSYGDFDEDPIAFTLYFPHNINKSVSSCRIYFKERQNFRSFALSLFRGEFYASGDADDPKFDLIPNRKDYPTPWTKIVLDGSEYTPEDTSKWGSIDLYLSSNPSVGHAIYQRTGISEWNAVPEFAYYNEAGSFDYQATGVITNNEQFRQAQSVDWSVLEHYWDPQPAKGFRFYCDYHSSTKICEFEVFCQAEDQGASLVGSVDVTHSHYGDRWWLADNYEIEGGVASFIGDSPRYLQIVIQPITEIQLSSVLMDVTSDDVFMGEKGCEFTFLPINARRGQDNEPTIMNFKNVYGSPYDLYVNIEGESEYSESVIYYNRLSDAATAQNPEIGPDTYFKKHQDYKLQHYQKNVAINCPVYGLKNLIDGAQAWYSHDEEYSWTYYGELTGETSTGFSNLDNMTITVIRMPVLSKNRYWKFGLYDTRAEFSIYEIRVYYEGSEIEGVTYYHLQDHDPYRGAMTNSEYAPHINNKIVDGSYYTLGENDYIGLKLPAVQKIDEVVIYHSNLDDFEDSHEIHGIDKATALYIRGNGDQFQKNTITDESYYEHEILSVGPNVYCDETGSTYHSYAFSKDFSNCAPIILTFSGTNYDPPGDDWMGVNNAFIYDNQLAITNNGSTGNVTTSGIYEGDFDVTVELNLDSTNSGIVWERSWISHFRVDNTVNGNYARISRKFHYTDEHIFSSDVYWSSGLTTIYERDAELYSTTLRLKRSQDTLRFYYYDSDWVSMGSTTRFGTDSVTFSLQHEFTPFHTGTTTSGTFDNFNMNRDEYDWETDISNASSFVCVSGTASGTVNPWRLEFDMGQNYNGNPFAAKKPQVFPQSSNNKPFDQDHWFRFDFRVYLDEILGSNGQPYDDRVWLSLGVGDQYWSNTNNWYPKEYLYGGVQAVFTATNVGIGYQNRWAEGGNTPNWHALAVRDNEYYCRLTSSGNGYYYLTMWTDDFDGSNKVMEIEEYNTIKWEADKVGVWSSASYNWVWETSRISGWTSDWDFACDKTDANQKIGKSSIYFSGGNDDYINIDKDAGPLCNISRDNFNFDGIYFQFDFYIKIETLPAPGEIQVLFERWDPSQSLTGNAQSTTDSSWIFYLENTNGIVYVKGRCINPSNDRVSEMFNYGWGPTANRWYHIYFGSSTASFGGRQHWTQDGHSIALFGWSTNGKDSNQDLRIGRNFKGWLDNIRVSSDVGYSGARSMYIYYNTKYQNVSKNPPTEEYEKRYLYSFFNGVPGLYGKYADVDTVFSHSYGYYYPQSYFSKEYYSYFAVDLGQRYNIDLVRSFPVNTAYQFTKTDNILYSNKDTDDPEEAFALTDEEADPSTDFTDEDGAFPNNWTKQDTEGAESYIVNNEFRQIAQGNGVSAGAQSRFYLTGNFDIEIDYLIPNPRNVGEWEAGLEVVYLDNPNYFRVSLLRNYDTSSDHIYTVRRRDSASSYTDEITYDTDHNYGSMRIVRADDTFIFYQKHRDATSWTEIGFYQMRNDFGPTVYLNIYASSTSPNYPEIDVFWDNFTINEGVPMWSTYEDARWFRVKLLNGDGTDRTLRRMGMYPDITVQRGPGGGYNCEWTSLGTSITSYPRGDNVALGATVSGSDWVGFGNPERVTDGRLMRTFSDCWCGETEMPQWITIHLPNEEEVYRFVIYHGYDGEDTKHIINNYEVQVSTDNETFTTVYSITGNTEFYRVHDLVEPVTAKYVRIYVTSYTGQNVYVWDGELGRYRFWTGPVLREVEVYKYYGYTSVNSEEYPIIAIDLQDGFFMEGHELVGMVTESTETDWDNSDSNFTYAGSFLSEPHKVTFDDWGTTPYFEKWVAIRRDTAENWPTTNDDADYLKHAVIQASVNEVGYAPVPTEYVWWWRSSISTLSVDEQRVIYDASVKSLKINYPASTTSDHIYYIEGDHFGWDEHASWRDGFGFALYIDDVDNLDLSYGYFYFGGFDPTPQENPVVYRWNMTTLSGVLQTGWNRLNLTFKYADYVEWTEEEESESADPRIVHNLKLATMGFVFRGKGQPLEMNFDGFFVRRNRFEHYTLFDYGLYLHDHDLLKAPIGDLNLHTGTIEFILRPDWYFNGRDIYNQYKYRSLFHISNTANDVLGASVSNRGLEVYFGNLKDDFNVAALDLHPAIDTLDKVFHIAFVYSNDGTKIGSDGSTLRVYINNSLIGSSSETWEVSDDKFFDFTLGGQSVLMQKQQGFTQTSSAVDGVVANLKIFNYCKTDFTDSLNDTFSGGQKLTTPNTLISISKDNLTYHKVGSDELPFYFEKVPTGSGIPIYVKMDIPKDLSGFERRTAGIVSSWHIGV